MYYIKKPKLQELIKFFERKKKFTSVLKTCYCLKLWKK